MADDQEFPRDVVEAVRREMCASCHGGGVCEAPPCDCARDILRTLAALGYRRVGPGEVVMPREPTEAWWNSLAVRLDAHPQSIYMDRLRRAWPDLMRAAAPAPQREGGA